MPTIKVTLKIPADTVSVVIDDNEVSVNEYLGICAPFPNDATNLRIYKLRRALRTSVLELQGTMSAPDFGKKYGISNYTHYRILKLASLPRMSTMHKLAIKLNTTQKYLLGG